MFDMVMEVDRLRADKSGTYPTFLEEAEDYQIFFDLIQQYLSSTHTLPEFVDKNDKWNDFIKPKMEKQTVIFIFFFKFLIHFFFLRLLKNRHNKLYHLFKKKRKFLLIQ